MEYQFDSTIKIILIIDHEQIQRDLVIVVNKKLSKMIVQINYV